MILFSYLATPKPTLQQGPGASLTHSLLITAPFLIQSEGHLEPCNEVGIKA